MKSIFIKTHFSTWRLPGILITALLIQTNTSAQLVNIEDKRMQSDTTGWLGSIGAALELQKSTTQVTNISANAQLQYKSAKSLYLLLLNYELLKGEGTTFQKDIFYHLRYNYKVTPRLRWEAFHQLQNNNVTGIRLRFLMGTGPRFKLSGTNKLALYAATAVMYENEKETKGARHEDIRSSSYLTLSWRPAAYAEFITTAFYQPLFKEFSDFRILHELKLKFLFTKKFSFFTTWNLLYDSQPAIGIPHETHNLKSGFGYDF